MMISIIIEIKQGNSAGIITQNGTSAALLWYYHRTTSVLVPNPLVGSAERVRYYPRTFRYYPHTPSVVLPNGLGGSI